MRRVLPLLLVVGLVLAGCKSPDEPEPEPSPSPSPSPTAEPSPEPTDAFPLTGVPTFEPKLDEPVLAVKIDHAPAARPQVGLDVADIVYEELVEGGSTRFMVLFHSTVPEVVGPIRSGRPVDIALLVPWSPVFVYSGARGEVQSALRSAGIGLVEDSGPPVFFRQSGRRAPHNLMVNTDRVLERAAAMDSVQPVGDGPYTFAPDSPQGGVDQPSFEIRMSSVYRTGWDWDEDEQVFRRSQNGVPSDVTGDGRIGAANVVSILTDIVPGGCCDAGGNPYVDTRLTGGGDAVVWRDGQRFEASWVKADNASHLTLVTPDGLPFPFAPGPTWFHLAGPNSAPPAPSNDG